MLTDLLTKIGVPAMPPEKPVVGVSACLIGEPVRYDGDHKHEPLVTDKLAPYFRYRDYCPEVGIGMSVPRPPIQVVRLENGHRVRAVDDPSRDVTDALRGYADGVQALHGYILKARSPSCGLGTTPVMNEADQQIDTGSGAFATRLRERFPHMPLCNESDLEDENMLQIFLLSVYLYQRWQDNQDTVALRQRTRALPEPLQAMLGDWINALPGNGH
jgi:uncharacterized protein YbbK (DUF523 family)